MDRSTRHTKDNFTWKGATNSFTLVNLANAAFFAFMAARMSSTAPTNSFMPSTKISTKEEEKRNTLHNPEVRQSGMIDTRNNEKDGRVVLQAAYSVEMHA
jgi:hypothetical protein